ncbi:MAG: ATP-binding cassette domain-containing protein [Planctomycetota bacterium]|jgi:putative ABC transport system ATP-binding protein|nr:ATP-binding cassette domain-containing protein [Planctomycetota bacterium]
MSLLQAEGLQTPVFGPWSLRIEAGEIVTVFGPSGSGKSRLLRALADLDPHQGSVHHAGIEQVAMSGPQWRQRVALLPAEPAWWEQRVGDHLSQDDVTDQRLSSLGLEPGAVRDWTVERCSTGERQRLALVRVLGLEPSVLLLDEATANLDAGGVAAVEVVVRQWLDAEQERAVLWVSHDPDQRQRIATRGYAIEDRQLVAAP